MSVVRTKMILISGAGRNVGKTTLCCRIIQLLSTQHSVTGIKISNHQHSTTDKQRVIYQTPGITIFEEHDQISTKDSTRYLNAGATQSFFIQTNDESIPEVVQWINMNIKDWIVCESRLLGNYFTPSLGIFVTSLKPTKVPQWEFPYEITIFENEQFTPNEGLLLKGLI